MAPPLTRCATVVTNHEAFDVAKHMETVADDFEALEANHEAKSLATHRANVAANHERFDVAIVEVNANVNHLFLMVGDDLTKNGSTRSHPSCLP